MAEIKTGSKPVCAKQMHTHKVDVAACDANRENVVQAAVESGGFEFNDADLAALNAGAGRGIVRGLAAQAVLGCIAALVCWVVAGSAAGLSALIGAGAYFVPNALFAARLLLGLFGTTRPSPFGFFLGEAFKLGLAVLLLGLAANLGGAWLVWPAFLLGLLCVLKGYVLLLAAPRLR